MAKLIDGEVALLKATYVTPSLRNADGKILSNSKKNLHSPVTKILQHSQKS